MVRGHRLQTICPSYQRHTQTMGPAMICHAGPGRPAGWQCERLLMDLLHARMHPHKHQTSDLACACHKPEARRIEGPYTHIRTHRRRVSMPAAEMRSSDRHIMGSAGRHKGSL